jgi:hypothetical protein
MGHRLTKRRIPADTHVIELSAAGEIVVYSRSTSSLFEIVIAYR